MSTCDDTRMELGALVLGALDPADEGRVRAHLETCDACAAEAGSLRRTASVLGAEPAAGLAARPGSADVPREPEGEPPADLLPRLLQAVAERHRSRRRRVVAGAAAAAALVVLAGVGGSVVGDGDGDGDGTAPQARPVATARPDATVSGADRGVRLEVGVWGEPWGSTVRATVHGVPAGSRCSLVAVGPGGRRDVAATWVVPGGGYAAGVVEVDGGVGLLPREVTRYEVVTADGAVLVTT